MGKRSNGSYKVGEEYGHSLKRRVQKGAEMGYYEVL